MGCNFTTKGAFRWKARRRERRPRGTEATGDPRTRTLPRVRRWQPRAETNSANEANFAPSDPCENNRPEKELCKKRPPPLGAGAAENEAKCTLQFEFVGRRRRAAPHPPRRLAAISPAVGSGRLASDAS